MLVLSLLVTPVAYSLLDDLSKVRILPRLWALARRSAPATAALLALAIALAPAPAAAQTPQAQPPATAQPVPLGEVLRLTSAEAVRMATANNPDLVAGGYDPRISAERTNQAKAAFLPTLTGAVQRNVQNAPAANALLGGEGVRTDLWSGNLGLAQRLPVAGGSYALGWSSVRSDASSTLSNFNPAITGQLQAIYAQPLLRDFKIDQARALVSVARDAERIANIGLQELATTVASSAERAYWALVAARANVSVQQRSLDLSLELERNNRARVDVGQSPPLDLVSAQAEVAQRRETLIVARTLVRQAEDNLRIVILDPNRTDYWFVRLDPVDQTPPIGPAPDVDSAVRNALTQRTDLDRSRRQIDIARTNESLAHNGTLPDLRLQASYLTSGLGGTELVRDGFFGPVIGQNFVAYGDVLRQMFAAEFPTWTLGVSLSYPLGRSAEQANYARTKLEREQALERLRSSEFKVVREVRQAAMQLDQNRQRIETTRLARELSAQRLDAEQRRFEVGMSTNFNVIQAQRDLAVAANSELQALLDYQIALINFQTVQRVGGTSATTVNTGTGTATVGTTTTPGGATVTTVTGTGGPGGGL